MFGRWSLLAFSFVLSHPNPKVAVRSPFLELCVYHLLLFEQKNSLLYKKLLELITISLIQEYYSLSKHRIYRLRNVRGILLNVANYQMDILSLKAISLPKEIICSSFSDFNTVINSVSSI
jgi:hypothetical protein